MFDIYYLVPVTVARTQENNKNPLETMIGCEMPGVVQLKTLVRLMFIAKNYHLIYPQSSILWYQLSLSTPQ